MYLKRLPFQLVFIGICLLALLGLQGAARATPFVRAAQAEVDFVSADAQGVHLAWPGVRAANAALADLPTVRYQGYELPMQLITVLLDDNVQTAALDQITVVAEPWQEQLTPAAPLAPPVLDWQPTASAALPEAVALPTAPIFVLRQGRIHGQRIAVVAISPIYNDQGQTKLAATLTGIIPSVQLLDSTAADLLNTSRAAQASDGTIPPTPESSPQVNPLATTSAIKIIVENVGIQQLSGQALADAGLAIAGLDPAQLQLQHQGAPVPLELAGLVNGRLTPTSQLRFYAPVVGDRWNLDEHYWLTITPGDAGAQLRMPIRAVAAANAAPRDDAIERGVWVDNLLYDSIQAGGDGDHWFHAELDLTKDDVQSVTATPNRILPPALGTAVYTLTMSTRTRGVISFTVHTGGDVHQLSWLTDDGFYRSENWTGVISSSVQAAQVQIDVTAATVESDAPVKIDRMLWQMPATLAFNGRGAAFSGYDGEWRYRWSSAPPAAGEYLLYDVTAPNAPIRLTGANSSGFQDGPSAHDYVLAGPDTLFTPKVVAHTPVTLSAIKGADAIYIAPQQFLTALEPLVAHRQAQGYRVAVVDVQEIYDLWSYGQISAEAIRSFLRAAAADWQPAPRSVVLVGDSTWDPHNYEQKEYHTIFIPAYIAYVDPWLGEAACENCFAQLDGNDPVTGDDEENGASDFFAADLWLGRFPVRTTTELARLVAKIIRYETDPDMGSWRSQSIFLADNYVQGINGNGAPIFDPAGNFARVNDLAARRTLCLTDPLPALCQLTGANSDQNVTDEALAAQLRQLMTIAGVNIQRYYYDPQPHASAPDGDQPWRIADPQTVRDAGLAAMSQGAGLVTYNGHSHQWQWARLDTDVNVPGLLSLYDPDAMRNGDKLFITLSMTCLTGQFHKPAHSGTVLDERMLLAQNGGAIAVWGSAGLSVLHGHDALQRGFQQALWSDPPMTTPIGELLEAGYTELLTNSACCQDALQTFLLLGDPLTPARVRPRGPVYLPLISR